MIAKYTVRTANWQQDLELLQTLRIAAHGDSASANEVNLIDQQDELAEHWLALDAENNAIAAIRMLADGHIGRLAVLPGFRNQGIGQSLIEYVISHARANNFYQLYLYAPSQLKQFYLQQGFESVGDEFIESGIPRQKMCLPLLSQRLLAVHGGNFAVTNLNEVAAQLIQQTSRTLRILSYELDPATFENEKIIALISNLARKSRYTQVKLLVVDASIAVKRGHRLIDLQRRISSNIKLRKVSDDNHTIKENLLLADISGIICQDVKNREAIWANFNNQPIVSNYIAQFDELWERGLEDKDLRQLEL